MPDYLTDGFNDQSGGMDSSRTPETVEPRNYALGVNVVCRDGMPATRPIFRRLNIEVSEVFQTGYLQGAGGYYNPGTGVSLIVAAIAGRIFSVNPYTSDMAELTDAATRNDTTAETYFCQAESFLVINNGRDTPLIFDGANLRRATADEVPTGSLMAYGQGRLFVASPDRRAITAGDLAYGGSTRRLSILLSTPSANKTVISTTAAHNLANGDTVTITRHSSSPSIVGTWTVAVTGPTTFTIPVTLTSGGGGGFVDKANEGQESDVLRFTERNYLAESGTFRLPVWMGQVTAMFFFPIQDTGTGQGDLFVSGQSGGCTFKVAEPRETWLNIPFQRVALTEIGVCGARAFAQVNGDIFFGARDGIRSYRNARAEFGTYGNTPLSAEMQRIIQPTRLPVLFRASMAQFDNRLLYSTSPKILPGNDLITPARVIFQSITALDFQQSSRISKGSLAAYDGIWTGLDVMQLIPVRSATETRLFAWCWQKFEDGDRDRNNQLWEVTTRQAGYDEWHTCAGDRQTGPIKCSLETRAFTCGNWTELKRMLRADLWLGRIRGDVTLDASWKPDLHGGGWFAWEQLMLSAGACAQTFAGPGSFIFVIPPPTIVGGSSITQIDVASNPYSENLTLGDSNLYTGDAATGVVPGQNSGGLNIQADAVHLPGPGSLGTRQYYYSNGGAPGVGWRKAGTGATDQSGAIIPPGGLISIRRWRTIGFTWTPNKPGHREIRPALHAAQVRLNTPPDLEDKLTKRRADRGYSFQLRFDWTGMMQLQKLRLLTEAIVNASQGDPTNALIEDAGEDDLRPPALRHPVTDGDWANFILAPAACIEETTPTPSPTPTPTPTPPPSPEETIGATPPATPTPPETPTPPATPTPTPPATPTPTPPPTPPMTPTPPATPTPPLTPTPPVTPTPTPPETPTPPPTNVTQSPTPTPTPTPPPPTPTITPYNTPTPSSTPSPTPTPTPTATLTPTPPPTPSVTPTPEPTPPLTQPPPTPTPTPTP